MPTPKLTMCAGWHTRDEIENSLQAAKTLEDFRYWLRLQFAYPGPEIGFGITEAKAGQDAKAKVKKAASDFCRVLRCSEGEDAAGDCQFDNYRAVVLDTFPPSFEGGDWMVVLRVKQVKCKCHR